MASITPINTAKVQTCPHGLPHGACPICSGMGGGGAKKVSRPEPPKQTMSLSQMYAIWNRMKAADQRKEDMKADLQKQAAALQKTKESLTSMVQKLSVVLNKIESILPKPVVEVFHSVVNTVMKPINALIQKFPEIVNNFKEFIQNVKMQLFIAAEKLSSVFGEIKNFIQKKVSNSFKKFTKKVRKILNIFGLESGEDFEEDERINTEIYAFKAKEINILKEVFFKAVAKKQERNENADLSK